MRKGVVLCDGRWSSVVDVAGYALSSMGGWWSFVIGDCCSWWRVVVLGGGWSFVVGDRRLWMWVVVRGGVLSLMDGGWSFVVVWVCGVVVRVGCGRPQGVVAVRV